VEVRTGTRFFVDPADRSSQRRDDVEAEKPLITEGAYRILTWAFLGPLILFLAILVLFAVGVFEMP
jgi:hypothetical protein